MSSMKRKGASGSEAAIPILPASSGPEFQREFIIWQVNGENLETHSLNQPIGKECRNDPVILLLRKCTDSSDNGNINLSLSLA